MMLNGYDIKKDAPPPPTGKPNNPSIAPPVPSLGEWDAGDRTGPIPPRGWLLGNHFCRKAVSALIAPGGTGKTAVRMVQYLALATGRKLTEQHIFRRCRVLIVSLEDDDDELRRRIAAACIHHGIERSELKGWLFCAAPKGLKLVELTGNKSRKIGALDKALRDAIDRKKPDLIALDPFVKTHGLDDRQG
jgi:RecA-family ATPase